MGLFFNGSEVSEIIGSGSIEFNGAAVDRIFMNGTVVWSAYAPSGSQTFTASGTFTVPVGVTSVKVCMVGGGGSGAAGYDTYTSNQGGGYAGEAVSQDVSVVSGDTINVTVGAGGAYKNIPAGTSNKTNYNGSTGGASHFGALVASGGGYGHTGSNSYGGTGGSRSTCGGSGHHGQQDLKGYGGQSSGFSNGGSGKYVKCSTANAIAGAGGVGSGGGGAASEAGGAHCHSGPGITRSGAGGRGEVRISWG